MLVARPPQAPCWALRLSRQRAPAGEAAVRHLLLLRRYAALTPEGSGFIALNVPGLLAPGRRLQYAATAATESGWSTAFQSLHAPLRRRSSPADAPNRGGVDATDLLGPLAGGRLPRLDSGGESGRRRPLFHAPGVAQAFVMASTSTTRVIRQN